MSEQLKTSVTAARAMQILADLARRTPLRMLGGVCEQQKQISTAKMAGYIEQAGDELAGYAFNLRQHNDALHAEAEALRLQNAMLVTAASNINSDREALRAENGRISEYSRQQEELQQQTEARLDAVTGERNRLSNQRVDLRAELEAARLGISEAVELIDCISRHPTNRIPALDQARAALVKALTATPAPEVQSCALGGTGIIASLKGAFAEAKAEQGELQEAVHWRAVLDPSEVPMQLNPHEHVAGFTNRRAAEDWIAARLQMAGWHYTLEALYPGPQPAQVNRIPAGLYAELEALRTLRDATSVYLQGYMRDEIEDEESCSADQHDSACTVKLALDKARALEWKGGDK